MSDSTTSVITSDFPSLLNITTSAFSCAIALSALVIFALQQQGIGINWVSTRWVTTRDSR